MRTFLRTAGAIALSLIAVLLAAGTASAKTTPKAFAAKYHLKGSWRAKDSDKDGLTNLQEYKLGTDPKKADTDGDKLADGDELKVGDDPLDRDTDGDDVLDGAEHAGVITAFDGTTVTIKQFVGGNLTASLTDDVDCYGADDPDTSDDDSSDDDTADTSTADDGSADVSWNDDDPSADDDTSADDGSDETDVSDDDSSDQGCTDPRFKKGALIQMADVSKDGGQLWIDTLVLAPAE